MEYKAFLKEIVKYNKSMVNNSFETMDQIQNQSDKITDFVQNQASWIPKDSWVFVNGWNSLYKKGMQNYRESFNANFDRMEEFIETSQL